jgi:hypothetical protein
MRNPDTPQFDRATRTWWLDPDEFYQVRVDALEDELRGIDPGMRYLRSFGAGPVTIRVIWDGSRPPQEPKP